MVIGAFDTPGFDTMILLVSIFLVAFLFLIFVWLFWEPKGVNSEFGKAKKEWEEEVDKEAARLVRNGNSPDESMREAKRFINQTRRNAAEA